MYLDAPVTQGQRFGFWPPEWKYGVGQPALVSITYGTNRPWMHGSI
jgi:hypothetical protein